MTSEGIIFAALQAAAILLDALVRPRAGKSVRSLPGLVLQAIIMTALFGLFLALCGNAAVAAVLAVALQALFVLASNAKHSVLGEPLLFSDLALVGAIFRHPQFYLSAIGRFQKIAVAVAGAALLAVLACLFVPAPLPHLVGLALLLGAIATLATALRVSPWAKLARVPAAPEDVCRHGLLPTVLLYWLRWRESRDPPHCATVERQAPADQPELIVVIQCESFADPVELFGDASLALPGLGAARASAWQWGNLEVSGFGAYTMRTEYGVLYGRDEEALGFRRYDPFLTALGESSYALPARLKGWQGIFAHPHDMRFYNRAQIMPAGGFSELIGEDAFEKPGPDEGRYVTDAAIAKVILNLAARAEAPTFLYAVTIENHGPWAADGNNRDEDLVHSYVRLARHSDTMLTTLIDRLSALNRPAMLVFFGDHRPSIPGGSMPGSGRHTPYVLMRIDEKGQLVPGANARIDLTPAELHHAVLDLALGKPV